MMILWTVVLTVVSFVAIYAIGAYAPQSASWWVQNPMDAGRTTTAGERAPGAGTGVAH